MSLMYIGRGMSVPANKIIASTPSISAIAMAAGQSLMDDIFDDSGSDGSREGYDSFLVAAGSGSNLYDGAVGNYKWQKYTQRLIQTISKSVHNQLNTSYKSGNN